VGAHLVDEQHVLLRGIGPVDPEIARHSGIGMRSDALPHAVGVVPAAERPRLAGI
jgi:hypothetical protein